MPRRIIKRSQQWWPDPVGFGLASRKHIEETLHLMETPFDIPGKSVSDQQVKFLLLNAVTRGSTGMYPGYVDSDGYLHCYWSGTDSFVTYQRNINDPIKRSQLINAGWLNRDGSIRTTIDYKLNSSGFRCDHFDSSEGIAFFGCSFTYGVGLHHHQTWAAQVAQHYDTQCWNLGIPGQSLNAGTFYALHYLEKDLPNLRAIAVLKPPPGRLCIYKKFPDDNGLLLDNLLNIIENSHADVDAGLAVELLDHITLTTAMEYRKDLKILELIAASRNIPFVVLNSTDDHGEAHPTARDGSHFCHNWQSAIADKMIAQLDKYL